MQKLSFIVLLASLIVLAACKKEKEPEPEPEFCETISSKFGADIAPIISSNCAVSGCHDGNAEISLHLTNHANIKAGIENNQALFLAAINFTGTDASLWMPRPNPNQNATQNQKLPQSMIDKIECWIDRGMPND